MTDEETKPPLTLSVEGGWGSGKSSFMRMLQKEIEATEKVKADRLRQEIKDLQRGGKRQIEKDEKAKQPKEERVQLKRTQKEDKEIEASKKRVEELERVNDSFKEKNEKWKKKNEQRREKEERLTRLARLGENVYGLRYEIKTLEDEMDVLIKQGSNLVKQRNKLVKQRNKLVKQREKKIEQLNLPQKHNESEEDEVVLRNGIKDLQHRKEDDKSKQLKEKIGQLKHLNPKFVKFNAWRHDKAEALWAAFALEFLEQISTPKTFCERATLNGFKRLNLIRKRFNWQEK